MIRVPYETLHDEFLRVLSAIGFEERRARTAAMIFADASRDGVHSHGLNRFPTFVASVQKGIVRVDGEPERVASFGAIERWNGNLGPGNLNAHRSMNRAIELARDHGIGCVALQNTTHWMRGGTYGWQAADAGMIGMCWTNTKPNLPPWGAMDARLGNNPLVIAVPRPDGHVVLDMAMSQFSYGQLESHRLDGRPLPVDGGYDRDGEPTRDPAAIEASGRPLPIGFWKGSGLALVLDLLAAMLSGGNATHEVPDDEAGISQVFLAIDPEPLRRRGEEERLVDDVLAHLRDATPVSENGEVRYPGEGTLRARRESMEQGVQVQPEVWRRVRDLAREDRGASD